MKNKVISGGGGVGGEGKVSQNLESETFSDERLTRETPTYPLALPYSSIAIFICVWLFILATGL